MTVKVRPFPLNPFIGVDNPAFPVHNGGVAGTFNAFGWFRTLVNDGLGESINDANYFAGITSGTFV